LLQITVSLLVFPSGNVQITARAGFDDEDRSLWFHGHSRHEHVVCEDRRRRL
jgi:hypothetical protein